MAKGHTLLYTKCTNRGLFLGSPYSLEWSSQSWAWA